MPQSSFVRNSASSPHHLWSTGHELNKVSEFDFVDFLDASHRPSWVESIVGHDRVQRAGTSELEHSVKRLRRKLRSIIPKPSTTPALTPSTSQSSISVFSLESQVTLSKSPPRRVTKSPTSVSSRVSKAGRKRYAIRHVDHERTKAQNDEIFSCAGLGDASGIGLGISGLAEFENCRPAPAPPVETCQDETLAGCTLIREDVSEASLVTIRPWPPLTPTRQTFNILRQSDEYLRSTHISTSSVYIKALSDLHLAEPIGPEELQFSESLFAQTSRLPSPDLEHSQNSKSGTLKLTPIQSNLNSSSSTPRSLTRWLSRTPQSTGAASPNAASPPSPSPLMKKDPNGGFWLPKLPRRFPGWNTSRPTPDLLTAAQSYAVEIKKLRDTFNHPPDRTPHCGPPHLSHPSHPFTWATKNLHCFTCPSTRTCALCQVPCCTHSGLVSQLSQFTDPTHSAARLASRTVTLEHLKTQIRMIEAVDAFGAREAYTTFVRCEAGCGRLVCAGCAGRCGDEVCGLVRCKECEEDVWGLCGWHSGEGNVLSS